MSLTEAKRIANNATAYSTDQLDGAMTVILDSDRLTETQVTNLLNKIDPVLRSRLGK